MEYAEKVMNEIALSLEEKFSKDSGLFRVCEITLNNGSSHKVYFNFFYDEIIGVITFKAIIENLCDISLERIPIKINKNTVKSKIRNVKNIIKYSDNIIFIIEAAINVASARFKIKEGICTASKSEILLTIRSKQGIKINIIATFTKETEVLYFDTVSTIKGYYIPHFNLTSTDIKKINSINDLYRMCLKFTRPSLSYPYYR